jgi:hypothetical protein
MDVEGVRSQRVSLIVPRRSKRLQKVAERKSQKSDRQERPPQIGVSNSKEASETGPCKHRPKKMSRAKRQKEQYRSIDEYRHRILEKVNQECNEYRAAMLREEEERRNTTISFNRKKEVLEFCKNFLRQSKAKRKSVDAEEKPYEIKSVLKGSNEVYTGRASSKRNSILGVYNINQESVPELQSEEMSEVKPLRESVQSSPEKSPSISPKVSGKSSVDNKKDKTDK